MSDLEELFLLDSSEMEDATLEEQIENERIDTFLAITTERMLHGGGTPPTIAEEKNNDAHTIELNRLFIQPKRNGRSLPMRPYRKANANRPHRKIECDNFADFYETLTKDSYEAKELAELYSNYFSEITPADFGRLKVVKEYFTKTHYQKKFKDEKGNSKRIDKRIYKKKV